jgi:catechol 2,3-dioxygenase-like lactoylglutathione lyase family enzyme
MPSDSSTQLGSWTADHVGLRVPAFDDAVAWYSEKLDFQLKHSFRVGDITYGFLSPTSNDSFSFEIIAGPGAKGRPAYQDLAASQQLHGWHHLCFRVEDVPSTVTELVRRSVRIIQEPTDVPDAHLRFAFIADPWGNLLEIMQRI